MSTTSTTSARAGARERLRTPESPAEPENKSHGRAEAGRRSGPLAALASRVVCGGIAGALNVAIKRFPPVVRIETTNACNARCTICPHAAIRRPIRRMDDSVFASVIDQCATGGCREVHLHNFGEPLMDRGLAERVRLAKDRGIAKVKIFCNGSLMTAERARELIEAGLDEVKISFDGATAEEFERIRVPLKFQSVVDNVRTLVQLRNEAGARLRVNVACCSTSDKQGTMATLEKVVDGFSFGKVHNWASEDYETPGTIRKPCSRLWRTMTILASGEVSLCCLDYDGQQILGRLDGGQSLAAIWRGEPYRRVRRLHATARQDEISLCRNCTKAFL
ncbi:MAG: radical SAM/SPASM domain-containing protein [Planctomycetota bacterium]